MAEEIREQGRETEVEAHGTGPEEGASGGDSPGIEEARKNHIAQKRGRMVAAGVVAAVILAGIAVVVAGIFQYTSGWLIKCPSDLPVNDPAPILWKDVTTKRAESAPLGVPTSIAKNAAWKGSPATATSSTE